MAFIKCDKALELSTFGNSNGTNCDYRRESMDTVYLRFLKDIHRDETKTVKRYSGGGVIPMTNKTRLGDMITFMGA